MISTLIDSASIRPDYQPNVAYTGKTYRHCKCDKVAVKAGDYGCGGQCTYNHEVIRIQL